MTAKQMPDGAFSVASMTTEGAYRVTLDPPSCSCPHFTIRLAGSGQECKHIALLRQELAEETALARCTRKAARLSDAELLQYATQRAGTAAGAACLLEAARRLQETLRDEAMKEVFR